MTKKLKTEIGKDGQMYTQEEYDHFADGLKLYKESLQVENIYLYSIMALSVIMFAVILLFIWSIARW